MKKLLCMLMAVCSLAVTAQKEKTVTLDEVTVKGARIVKKVDGQWIYPTKQQIEAMNSITALINLGTVQVRINDIVATREDLQTLDMQGIDHIEFIDNPAVRYGEGIAYVIDIKVKKPISGYVLGTQLTNTLTAINGNELRKHLLLRLPREIPRIQRFRFLRELLEIQP